MEDKEEVSEDFDQGYYEGKAFAMRSVPLVPSRKELEDLALAFADAFDYDYEEAWGVVNRALVAIFPRYKGEHGFFIKVACVCYETSQRNFDHYEWKNSGCSLVKRVEEE